MSGLGVGKGICGLIPPEPAYGFGLGIGLLITGELNLGSGLNGNKFGFIGRPVAMSVPGAAMRPPELVGPCLTITSVRSGRIERAKGDAKFMPLIPCPKRFEKGLLPPS